MSTILPDAPPTEWTAVDLARRFGAIPLRRVRSKPEPGTATEQDLIDIHARENRLCELVDGILLEKTMGSYESYLAGRLFRWIADYVEQHDLGLCLPPDGMMRLAPGLVRVPDVSFIAWTKLPDRELPDGEVWAVVPDLAVEIISRGNTHEELAAKLVDYFGAGVRRVWHVEPELRLARVYHSPTEWVNLNEHQSIDGGTVLPGFRLSLERLFRRPEGPKS